MMVDVFEQANAFWREVAMGSSDEDARSHVGADGVAKPEESEQHSVVDESRDTGGEKRVGMSENGAETEANEAVEAAETATSTDDSSSELKRKRYDSDVDAEDGGNPDEFVKQYSRAQVKVKVKRARLEANIAVQDEIKTLRFALLEAEQRARDKEREREQAEQRYETLKESMEEIVRQHQRTLNGMRDNIKLESLVASLEKEKASKEALKEAFQKQNAELLRAQHRIDSLQTQITKYQKTETVLAQSISHFQHQYSSKDQEKAAVIEKVKQSLEAQHQETRVALEEEVQRLTLVKEALQMQLSELQVEHKALEESAQAVLEMQEKQHGEESEMRARVSKLETEKAVLVSKVEQVQKADAQLRSKIKAQEDQLLHLRHENEAQRKEIEELGKIASDLMDMAERQQQERQQITHQPDEEGEQRLARNRTRLRESLG